MPLIRCKDCGHDISDAAPHCIHCGCPTTTTQIAIARVQGVLPAEDPRYRCPQCGSPNVTKASLLHEQGISRSIRSSTGIAFTDDGEVGFVQGSSRGVSQSELSRKLAPPVQQSTAGEVLFCLFLGCVAAVIGGLLVGPWLALSLLVVAVIGALAIDGGRRPAYEAEYRQQRAKWDRLYVCNRCGEGFQLPNEPRRGEPAIHALRGPSLQVTAASTDKNPGLTREENANRRIGPGIAELYEQKRKTGLYVTLAVILLGVIGGVWKLRAYSALMEVRPHADSTTHRVVKSRSKTSEKVLISASPDDSVAISRRFDSSGDSDLVARLPAGTRVTVLEKRSLPSHLTRYRISFARDGRRTEGWVDDSRLR